MPGCVGVLLSDGESYSDYAFFIFDIRRFNIKFKEIFNF